MSLFVPCLEKINLTVLACVCVWIDRYYFKRKMKTNN